MTPAIGSRPGFCNGNNPFMNSVFFLPDFHLYSLSLAHSESVCIDFSLLPDLINPSIHGDLTVFRRLMGESVLVPRSVNS